MTWTRRDFAKIGLFGACLPGIAKEATVTLPALFAAELPACIALPGALVEKARAAGATILEQRVYALPIEFAARGIEPILRDGYTYLFAFASLEARTKAWDRWNAGSPGGKGLKAISIYTLKVPDLRT